jgi:DNA-binding LacI/PurR family transcriptional regulator
VIETDSLKSVPEIDNSRRSCKGAHMPPPVRPPLRIRDVAQRAAVSSATVSRVLNDSAPVGRRTREQVLAAIAELGYRPNRTASNLRRQQAQMIGVVISDIENPHFTQLVRAVEDAAYRRDFRVLLCNTDEDPAKQRHYLHVLTQERVAGAIISPTAASAPEISELIDHGTSVVAFDRAVRDRRADVVLSANVSGAQMGTEHLIGCGHRKIGYIGGPEGIETATERLTGYCQALSAARLRPMVAVGDFRFEGGARATHELIKKGVTALLVANNLMTVGSLHAIREAGLRVAQDIALVSIDDPPWAELTDPPLTTLAQPVRDMADAAVELLLGRLEGGRTRRKRQVFNFELNHRGSCCST